MCLYVLTAGALPFDEPNLGALFSKISRADYHTPAWFSEELAHLLHAILNPNPKERCAVLPFCALWAPQSWPLATDWDFCMHCVQHLCALTWLCYVQANN